VRDTVQRGAVTLLDLSAFQRDLLYVIGGMDNPHGQAIKDELEEYYETEVYHSQLLKSRYACQERPRQEGQA
jgi:hypothetical protein